MENKKAGKLQIVAFYKENGENAQEVFRQCVRTVMRERLQNREVRRER